MALLLAGRIGELARELVGTGPTTQHGEEWRYRARGSLSVVVRGADRGSWFDFEVWEGGDALALVAHLHRASMGEAYRWALGWLGMAGDGSPLPYQGSVPALPPEPVREVRPAVGRTLPLARDLWREGVDTADTIAARYLAGRGLEVPADAPLRFHPDCPRGAERWPAMLALMTDPATGEPCGVHRTFLARDGSGKAPGQAKMMAGRAGVVRLVPDAEVTHGLGLAEGIETALAVMQGTGWRPVWAATSAGAIARFPVLPGIEALTIFADADDAGLTAARRCADTWTAAGAEARILAAPPGQDFHDVLRGAA